MGRENSKGMKVEREVFTERVEEKNGCDGEGSS